MIRFFFVAMAVLLGCAGSNAWAQESGYEDALRSWKSYQDVGAWLDGNFSFDTARLSTMLKRRSQGGASSLLTRDPAKTFVLKSGYCTDAAGFAIASLNRINPDYKANYVFIRNGSGPANHWVAGFTVDGKIMIMDYGPGPEWRVIRGIHGPYDTLAEYQAFLSGLSVRGFSPIEVAWRDFPGQVD